MEGSTLAGEQASGPLVIPRTGATGGDRSGQPDRLGRVLRFGLPIGPTGPDRRTDSVPKAPGEASIEAEWTAHRKARPAGLKLTPGRPRWIPPSGAPPVLRLKRMTSQRPTAAQQRDHQQTAFIHQKQARAAAAGCRFDARPVLLQPPGNRLIVLLAGRAPGVLRRVPALPEPGAQVVGMEVHITPDRRRPGGGERPAIARRTEERRRGSQRPPRSSTSRQRAGQRGIDGAEIQRMCLRSSCKTSLQTAGWTDISVLRCYGPIASGFPQDGIAIDRNATRR